MTEDFLTLEREARYLAEQLYGKDIKKCADFVSSLVDLCGRLQGKDFLLIHNPGGWGNTRLDHCLHWEKSVVQGVMTTMEDLGYTYLLTQHFRTGFGWREIIGDMREQIRFFVIKREILGAKLEFVIRHIDQLRVLLVGVSQGAAFSNAVMQRLNGLDRVWSIELGIPFLYRSRRVITAQTLAVDSNGLMPDAMLEWDVRTVLKAFGGAPFRWIKYQLQGKPIKLAYCVNVPGHEYNWEYPEVRRQIGDFFSLKFGAKNNVEVGIS